MQQVDSRTCVKCVGQEEVLEEDEAKEKGQGSSEPAKV